MSNDISIVLARERVCTAMAVGAGTAASLLGLLFGACRCRAAFDCKLAVDRTTGVLLWFAICAYSAKVLTRVVDGWLVPALDRIVRRLRLEDDIAGATLNALGSSSAEFCACAVASSLLVNASGVGVVVGSSVFNLLAINGCIGANVPVGEAPPVPCGPMVRDLAFAALALLELGMFLSDGKVVLFEAAVMVATYGAYVAYLRFSRKPAKWGRCPQSAHILEPSVATCRGIHCGRCERKVQEREVVLECYQCSPNWYLCSDCFERDRKGDDEASTGEPADAPRLPIGGGAEAGCVQVASPQYRVPPAAEVVPIPVGAVVCAPGPDGAPRLYTVLEEDGGMVRVAWAEEGDGPDSEWIPASLICVAAEALPRGAASTKRSPRGERPRPWCSCAACCNWLLRSAGPLPAEGWQPASATAVGSGGWPGFWSAASDPAAWLVGCLLPHPKRGFARSAVASFAATFGLTYLVMDSGLRAGEVLHLQPRAVGILAVAAAISLPDALGAGVVAREGDGGFTVANSLGSTLFEVLFCLGGAWFVRILVTGSPVNYEAEKGALLADVLCLAAVMLYLVLVLAMSSFNVTRGAGRALIFAYVAYAAAVLATSSQASTAAAAAAA